MDAVSEIVNFLQKAFPEGVDGDRYFAVLVCLHEDMSDENLSKAVSRFTNKHRLDVWNDIPIAYSRRNANRAVIEEVSARLRGVGWEPEVMDDE